VQIEESPGPRRSDALIALGELRECVTATQNLSHLTSSLHVGTQVLQEVVPDVAQNLTQWAVLISTLMQIARETLVLENDELNRFESEAQEAGSSLCALLVQSSRGVFKAKERLLIERKLQSTLPRVSAALSGIELLMDPPHAPSLPTTIEDLLVGAPDLGSNRPHRPLAIFGNQQNLEVTTPARVALRALGALAGQHKISPPDHLGIQVKLVEGRARLRFVALKTVTNLRTVQLPVFAESAHSSALVRAVLRPFGGIVSKNGQEITLPACSIQQAPVQALL